LNEVGHFDLLFTVLYAAIVVDIFHTIAKAPLSSFEFLLGTTLLVVVVDHWLLHFRNHTEINQHKYFSLVTVGLTLFFYAKANEILSTRGKALLEGQHFWFWIILMFCTSYVMKWYYKADKSFHRIWDFIAIAACTVYILGIHCCGWTNGITLGAMSLGLAVAYVPFEWRHYRFHSAG